MRPCGSFRKSFGRKLRNVLKNLKEFGEEEIENEVTKTNRGVGFSSIHDNYSQVRCSALGVAALLAKYPAGRVGTMDASKLAGPFATIGSWFAARKQNE